MADLGFLKTKFHVMGEGAIHILYKTYEILKTS
jgi:hypothetical protein